MVPTAGLEPAQVAPLAPQTSASTNFATSAFQWPYGQLIMASRPTFNGVRRANPDKQAARSAVKTKPNSRQKQSSQKSRAPNYFGGSLGAGAGVAGAFAGAAGAGAAGVVGAVVAGAGVLNSDRSNTLVGSPGARVPMYASNKLVAKNSPANSAVNLENSVLVPRAPKTVPDAPEPKPAPASAPLPRCSKTRPIIISASSTCTAKIKPRNIEISQ